MRLACAAQGRRVLALALTIATLSCGAPESRNDDVRPERGRYLRLPAGDSLSVMPLKYSALDDGSPPSLTLEYIAPDGRLDSASAFAMADRIWPVFAPYVEASKVHRAVLVRKVRDTTSFAHVPIQTSRSFGIAIVRRASEPWQYEATGKPLSTSILPDSVASLTDGTGSPISAASFGTTISATIASMQKLMGP